MPVSEERPQRPTAAKKPALPRSIWRSIGSVLGIGSLKDWLFKNLCLVSALILLLLVVLIVALLDRKSVV